MKKLTHRAWLKAASAVSAVAIMAGCGGSVASSAASTTASSASAATGETTAAKDYSDISANFDITKYATAADNGVELPALEGPLKLNISIIDYNQSSENTKVQKLWEACMEHYLGCELDITWKRTPLQDYQANELVVLQSGDVPDIATLNKGSAVNEYGEDGTVLNLANYMDQLYYYKQFMQETNGGEKFAMNEDGSMYYFMDGFYNPDDIQGAQSFTSFAYRFDLLKEAGLTPATTLDEFTELCKNLKAKIDDGSLDIQYPIINSTKDYSLYRGFVGVFHTWDCVYYNEGSWRFGPIEDNFREMLKYLKTLYDAGYVDPEFATADTTAGQTKATTGVGAICPNLWSGSAAAWNTAATDKTVQWGLSYLPKNETYGTPWKWGSKQAGKSLSSYLKGIYIGGATEHPEYAVAMVDYQYSDEMIELTNWGVEGEEYTTANDENTFVDSITSTENPALTVADLGIISSGVCGSGIPCSPYDFNSMLSVSSLPEPWWNATDGYYEGKYWVESDRLGGEDSVAPYDRPPVMYLTAEESTQKAQLDYGGACESRVKQLAVEFITGQRDINDDGAWADYIKDIKSQTDEDFDTIIATLNENTVK
ncbi:MAG: extracellular solute-binding protein [Gemmiger sp.]|nr:extracellular solute-binding protein [Gemmiger sp.]